MTDYYVLEHRDARAPTAYAADKADAETWLAQLQANEPGKYANSVIVTSSEFFAGREAAYLAEPVREVDAATFTEMLGMLPPADWHHDRGIERFCIPELLIGRAAVQYARLGDRYFRKNVRIGDRSTYFVPDDIPAALPLAA